MARFLLRIEEVAARPRTPARRTPTVNAAMIHGGSAPNVVADRCVVEIDRRIVPGETEPERCSHRSTALADAIRTEHPETDLSLRDRRVDRRGRGQRGPGDRRRCARTAVRAETGRAPLDAGFTGITDARFYINEAEIPTIIFGPGSLGRGAHRGRVRRDRRAGGRGAHLCPGVRAVPRRFVISPRVRDADAGYPGGVEQTATVITVTDGPPARSGSSPPRRGGASRCSASGWSPVGARASPTSWPSPMPPRRTTT